MAVVKYKSNGSWVTIPSLDGEDGVTPIVTVSATTLESGATPSVSTGGTATNPTITLNIPRGKVGTIPNESSYLTKSIDRGVLGGYNVPYVTANTLTINQDSNDTNQVTGAVQIIVENGTTGTEWTKTVSIVDTGTSISLGDSWLWSGGEAPTVTENSVLALYWCNDTGIANLIEGAQIVKSYKTLRFKASADASNLNMFKNISTTYHDVNYYDVYVNDVLTDMDFNNLTFSTGDNVLIDCFGEYGFPQINCSEKDYFESFETLPSQSTQSGTDTANYEVLFRNCKSLKAIGKNFFKNIPSLSSLHSSFYGCESLSSIPNGLFDNNPNAGNFSYTFYKCSNLNSIPEGLFDNNVNAYYFYRTFYGCNALTSIPNGLFDNNTKCSDFGGVFYGC